ncbi:hypothetical protein [Sphingomonas sp. CFBP 8760]|uniref:hypothetical protein n=1 Tax=Sphingomonas sp. CFBP 8760 TaxID=2775282 RepID=UPI00177C5EC4|nr:hypothetical protein [Sphingomonas sp. CFBP 8760]MBD8545381.1 hypothetical protein [Sphingomonas sp. CFBP 8760]
MTRDPRRLVPLAAILSFAAALALFWPGIAEYDSVLQYAQALSGRYDDWHPPVMARLWSVLIATVGPGTGPMLILQLGGYVIGLALIAAALLRDGRPRAALAVAAIGWWPPFLGWQGVVLKDAQAVAAMVAALGLVGWYRLGGRAVPWPARCAVATILLYALLVRANAVFAIAPLIAGLAVTAGPVRRVGIAVAIVAATLALSPAINHHLLRATGSGVEKTQPFYDLAGIATRTGTTATGFTATGFTAAEARGLVAHRCVTPFFWDRLGDAPGCGPATVRMWRQPAGALYRQLALAAATHPVAYLSHRLAHLNSTDRWWVPAHWPGAAPPGGSEPNDLGLAEPRSAATEWERLAGWLAGTPAGWPVVWIAVAIVALAAGWRIAGPGAGIARALLASALALEASFAVISIASDLRYHLWPMIATALALALLGRMPWRGHWRIALIAVLAGVIAIGGIARIVLPSPPQSYADWMA